MPKANVTWFLDGILPGGPGATKTKLCYPGVMEHEDGSAWSVVLRRDDDGLEVMMLTPEAPELVPGMAFDVYQGRAKTCHIEVLSWWVACKQCDWFEIPVNTATKNECPLCKEGLTIFTGTLAERQQQLEERELEEREPT